MGPISSPETSVSNHHLLHNDPEDRRIQGSFSLHEQLCLTKQHSYNDHTLHSSSGFCESITLIMLPPGCTRGSDQAITEKEH